MSKGLIVVIVLVLLALALFGKYVSVKNTLVTKNESVKSAWSQVDVVLQRRADLIPNLVETVKGYAQQEVRPSSATSPGPARSCSPPARRSDKIAANQQLDGALAGCLLLSKIIPS